MEVAKPSVTVLMTVYNPGRYFRQAIESVLAQTYADFEFLVVDDASTDGSLEVIRSYHDSRIRIIHNVFNRGQTASLNIGLREARGNYVARVDADDVALPAWLELQTAAVSRDTDGCSIFSCWAVVIDEKGLVKQLLQIPLIHAGMKLRALTASPVNHGGCLMKRDVVLRYGGYDEQYSILADFDLWARLLEGGEKFFSARAVLMAVRFHSGSVSRVEKDRAVSGELEKVFQHYIRYLTALEFNAAELRLLRELCYNVERMSLVDMEEAVLLLKKVYTAAGIDGISRAEIMGHWRERVKVFVVKKVFACLDVKDAEGVFLASLLFERHCGPALMMKVFRCLPYLGPLGRLICGLYVFKNRLTALKTVGNYCLSGSAAVCS